MFRFFRKSSQKVKTQEQDHTPSSKDILHQLYDWADERDYAAIEEYLPRLDEEDHVPAIMGICFSFLYNVQYEFPYQRAVEYLGTIRERMKASAAWHYDMAYALLYQNEFEEAGQAAYEGIQAAPECAYLWLIYSKALYCSGQKEKALEAAESALGKEKNGEVSEWIDSMKSGVSTHEVLDDELPYTRASNDFTMPDEMRERQRQESQV